MRTQVETVVNHPTPFAKSFDAPVAAPTRLNRWSKFGIGFLLAAFLIVAGAGLVTSLAPPTYYASGIIEVSSPNGERVAVVGETIRLTPPDKRAQVVVVQQKNPSLYEIGFYAAQPQEAANVANQILAAVQDHFSSRPGVHVKLWQKSEAPATQARARAGRVVAVAAFICIPFLILPGIVLLVIGLVRRNSTAKAATTTTLSRLGWAWLILGVLVFIAVGLVVPVVAGAFWFYSRAGQARSEEVAASEAARHAQEARQAAAMAAPKNLVPQSVVDTARVSLQRAEALYKVGTTDYVSVLKAQEQLKWAEAMFTGDKLGAAVARRDGAKQQLEIMAKQQESGVLTPDQMVPVERDLAEAEAQISELQGAIPPPGGPPNPR